MKKEKTGTVPVNIKYIMRNSTESIKNQLALGEIQGENHNGFTANEMVLLQIPEQSKDQVDVDYRNILKLPGSPPTKELEILPELTFALWAWDRLQLELGECALISGEHPFVGTLLETALWYGAMPVLYLTERPVEQRNVQTIGINHDDPEETIAMLAAALKMKKGFAAIDTSGSAGVIDIILNVLPQWGRLLFAGPDTEPLTLDYYNNLHRSGSRIRSTDVNQDDIISWINRNDCEYQIHRAFRILKSQGMVEKLIPEKDPQAGK